MELQLQSGASACRYIRRNTEKDFVKLPHSHQMFRAQRWLFSDEFVVVVVILCRGMHLSDCAQDLKNDRWHRMKSTFCDIEWMLEISIS